jgi:hypothetical protein
MRSSKGQRIGLIGYGIGMLPAAQLPLRLAWVGGLENRLPGKYAIND